MRYTNNHFLTLVEPFDAHSETIVSYRHTKAVRQQPTVYLATDRGKWLEIVHEDNVSNDFRINIKVWYIPLLCGRRFADFGLPDLHLPGLRQWFCTLCVVPARFLVTAARRLRIRPDILRSIEEAASGRCGGLRYLSTGYLLLKRNPTPSIR